MATNVSSALYDELKTLAALREPCTLQFSAPSRGAGTINTVIVDVFQDDDGAYLVAENGFTLALQHLVALNGKPVASFC